MNKKMKACFTPHVIVHSLIGFGLGIIVADLIIGYHSHHLLLAVGIIIVVAAFIADATRKD